MNTLINTVAIRRSGGASVISLPKAMLQTLHLDIGAKLELYLEDGRIVMRPATEKPTLESLLEGCTPKDFAPDQEGLEWDQMQPAGREV